MADLDVGRAATAGFRLVGRNFGAVAIWGVVAFLLFIVPLLLAIPQFMETMRAASAGAGGTPTPPALGANPFASLVSLPFSVASVALLQAAVYRCLLAPQQGGLGYIRLGAAELYLAVFFLGFVILVVLLLMMAAGVFGVIVYAGGRANSAIPWLVGIPYWIGVAAGFVWLVCRLSMVGPSIVATGELRLGEAWALTKGRVMNLFLTALLNWVIMVALAIAIYIAIIILVVIVAAAVGASLGGAMANPADLGNIIQHMGAGIIAVLVIFGLLLLIAYMLIGAVFQAIAYAPWADAYEQIARPDTAQTFA